MPKATFYNLSEEKKQTLTQAVIKEFSRVPLHEASISNIVKEAGIPRGSFYQYFDDKEDAFFYVLRELTNREPFHFSSILEQKNGDIFAAMVTLYENVLNETEHFHFFKNAFLNMTLKIESAFSECVSEQADYEHILCKINKSLLNVNCDQEARLLIHILTTVAFRNIAEAFANGRSPEESMDSFILTMNMLRRGLCRTAQ